MCHCRVKHFTVAFTDISSFMYLNFAALDTYYRCRPIRCLASPSKYYWTTIFWHCLCGDKRLCFITLPFYIRHTQIMCQNKHFSCNEKQNEQKHKISSPLCRSKFSKGRGNPFHTMTISHQIHHVTVSHLYTGSDQRLHVTLTFRP